MPSSMQKITEKLLIERGFPKSSKLEQIHSLNLSKMGLRCEELPVLLLSRLVCLERLDLSGNRLREFPAALCLPALKHLDLSDNQIEDVCSLQCLSVLEELCLDDNLYITVSDNYKLMVLLPQLRMYNRKDITATANHLRYVYTENLRTQIISVWERSFSLPQLRSADKLAALEANFVHMAKQQVKFGPSSVSDFTKWRVGIMAAEFFKFQTQQKDRPHTKEFTAHQDSENATSLKRKKAVSPVAATKQTPAKKASIAPVSQIQESSCKSGLQLMGQGQNQSGPHKSSTPSSSPRTNRKSRQDSGSHQTSSSPAKHLLPRAKSPNEVQKPVCLRIHHVLQCHSKQDSTDDLSTQLWTAAFQPSSDGLSRLVATCGGDSVCLIDCELGLVMKKYKVFGEEFFSLAWTTVLMCCGQGTAAQPCSILAAGGKRGIVKLIHPWNNIAYGEFRASHKALSVLRFNPNKGNFLYTGSYDNKIVLWDIGGLDKHYNYKVIQLMSLECNSTPLHLCIPPKAPLSHVLTACDNGLHCYSTHVPSTTTNRWKQREVTFPVYKEEDSEHDYHTVDGLSFLSDDIVASKNYMHRSIYLWSFSQTLAQQPHKKTGCVSAVVLAELQWTSTQVPYLALSTCPGHSYVVCGDNRGRLWTYHIGDLKESIAPQILEWPSLRNDKGLVEGPSINSVAMDPELQYLVALTDRNMVVVWRREEMP